MFEFIILNKEFFLFVLFLSIFLFWKRKNVEVSGSFPFLYMIMYRTKLGLGKMDRWSKNHPRVFLYLSYLSIFIGIVGTIVMFFFMFWQLGFIVDNNITQGGGLVLPIQTENGLDSAVPVFYVPFWYWLIALFILVIVHEFAHGVIAERFNIRIKSSGFAFLGILAPIMPAAFVEPDDKQLKKKPRWQQIAVFGAGSTSNFIFGFIFIGLWLLVAGPILNSTMEIDKISFSNVLNDSDLKNYNLSSGEILAFNNNYDKKSFISGIYNLTVNQNINLTINSSNGKVQTYNINTYENPNFKNKSMIGISGLKFEYKNKVGYEFLGNTPMQFEKLLFYIWFLNIAIGMMNLLPLWITDGGQICKSICSKYFKKKKANRIYNMISIVSLIMIIFTVWPSLMFKLLGLN